MDLLLNLKKIPKQRKMESKTNKKKDIISLPVILPTKSDFSTANLA